MITACENFCRDFSWLIEWLTEVAKNPIWALFFGFWISLYIWRSQTKLSSELDLNREKRSLYREFIAQVGKAVLAKDTETCTPWYFHPEVRRVWALQSEIALIGSEIVGEKTKVVLEALQSRFAKSEPTMKCSDGVLRKVDDCIRFELVRSIEYMKADINRDQ